MRSFIIIAGLSTKCTCLCKKKNHWVFDTDISAGFFIANQFANQFSINARKHLKLLNSIFLFFNKCKDGFDTIKISFVALFGC